MSYKSVISPDRLLYISLIIPVLIGKTKGAIAEVGIYKGGSLARIADAFPEKTIFGIDSFEGLPELSDIDKNESEKKTHTKGDFADVNYEETVFWFKENKPNVEIIKGFFPNQEIREILNKRRFCLVHIDVDLYQSVKDCCDFFYPRLNPGGALLLDDYGFETTPGAKIAVDEFFEDKTDCVKRALKTKQFLVWKKT